MTHASEPLLPIYLYAEAVLRDHAAALVGVRRGECHPCYLQRMLAEHECMEFRFSEAYRDQVAPAATALVDRLAGPLGCRCDCETLRFVFISTEEVDASARRLAMRLGIEVVDLQREDLRDTGGPRDACHGVRRGSVRPCGRWRRLQRRRYRRW